jgi:hypothetical protein
MPIEMTYELKMLLNHARRLKRKMGASSVSFLMRKFKLTYEMAEFIHDKVK